VGFIFPPLTMFFHINHMLRNLSLDHNRFAASLVSDLSVSQQGLTELSMAGGRAQAIPYLLVAANPSGIKYAGARVGGRSRVSRKRRTRTAPGRACARRYGRHLGRGSLPQQPSSRFHGFAPREPNWLVAAPQSDSDSFDVSPSMDSIPWSGVEQTEVKKDRTSPTNAGDSSHVPKAILGSSERHQKRTGPSRHRVNSPQLRLSVRPCSSPPPGLIERPEAAQVNVHAGIIPA
jgi:hypothetical protein